VQEGSGYALAKGIFQRVAISGKQGYTILMIPSDGSKKRERGSSNDIRDTSRSG